jgi:acyl carrier protein
MANEKTKKEVTEKLICMLIDSLGWITREEILLDVNLASGLHIDGDDLSFFIMEVEDYFDMQLTQNEWGRVGTLQETIDLVLLYRGMKLRPATEQGLRAWFRRWFF